MRPSLFSSMLPFWMFTLVCSAATCQSTAPVRLKEAVVAPCVDQDSLFRESVSQLKHHINGEEVQLEFIFTAACCQTIKVEMQEGSAPPAIDLKLLKSGEICDCYCNYPVKVTLTVPEIKQIPALQLRINKKPAGTIPTGF